MDKFNNLQGLRFIAFIFVFYNHSYWLIDNNTYYLGARGVEIFFCLSGYLIAYHYSDIEKGYSIKDSLVYLKNKVKKFYMLHLLTFFCFFILSFKDYLSNSFNNEQTKEFFISAFFNITLLRSWVPNVEFLFNGPTWFLSSIIFSYFFVPQVIHFYKNKSNIFYLLFFLLIFFIKVYIFFLGIKLPWIYDFVNLYINPLYRFLDFLLGYNFYLITYKVQKECLPPRWIDAFQIGMLLLYISACFLFYKICTPGIYVLMALTLIYSLTFKGKILKQIIGNKLFVYLGNITFELFILHMLSIRVCNYFNKVILDNFFIKKEIWLICLLASILMGIIVREKPWKYFYGKKI